MKDNKSISLNEAINRDVGEMGTKERDEFEQEVISEIKKWTFTWWCSEILTYLFAIILTVFLVAGAIFIGLFIGGNVTIIW